MSPSDSRLRLSQWIAGLGGLAIGTVLSLALITDLGAQARLSAPTPHETWIDGDWGVAPDPAQSAGEVPEDGQTITLELQPATLDSAP